MNQEDINKAAEEHGTRLIQSKLPWRQEQVGSCKKSFLEGAGYVYSRHKIIVSNMTKVMYVFMICMLASIITGLVIIYQITHK